MAGGPKITVGVVGEVYGRLTVESEGERVGAQRQRTLNCLCTCGKRKTVRLSDLRKGTTTSCGCASRERASAQLTSHGMSRTRIYQIWHMMKARCTNPNEKDYPRYGGRGIRVCEEWATSFETFVRDMGEPPTDQHTIERKENDGPYAPWNCRWATMVEQANNRRNNRHLVYNGASKTLAEWSRLLGINSKTIQHRLKKGLSVEQALSTPILSTASRTAPRKKGTKSP